MDECRGQKGGRLRTSSRVFLQKEQVQTLRSCFWQTLDPQFRLVHASLEDVLRVRESSIGCQWPLEWLVVTLPVPRHAHCVLLSRPIQLVDLGNAPWLLTYSLNPKPCPETENPGQASSLQSAHEPTAASCASNSQRALPLSRGTPLAKS